jgi:hypothetical protein
MANDQNQLNRIDHIVVLMMENRSFDNVLGWLYDEKNPPPRNQTFEGVAGKNLSNPRSIPPDGNNVPVGKGTVMTDPYPDPNEPYDYVYSHSVRSVVQLGPDSDFSQSLICARGDVFGLRDQLLENRHAPLGHGLPAEHDSDDLQLAFREGNRLADLLR